jgi:hypothetical protein
LDRVQSLDWTSLSFLADMPFTTTVIWPEPAFEDNGTDQRIVASVYSYNGPSHAIQLAASAAAAQGVILPIPPPLFDRHPAINASWDLVFYGPSLKCSLMDEAKRLNVSRSLADYNFQNPPSLYDNRSSTDLNAEKSTCDIPYGYLAWADTNFQELSYNSSFSPQPISSWGESAELFVVTVPAMIHPFTCLAEDSDPFPCLAKQDGNINSSITPSNPLGIYANNSTMLHCRLFNASYQTHFEYVNGEQSISVHRTSIGSQLSVLGRAVGPSLQPLNCTFLLDYDSLPENYSAFEELAEGCIINRTIVETMSYQAVFEAFNQLIIGSVQASGSMQAKRMEGGHFNEKHQHNVYQAT